MIVSINEKPDYAAFSSLMKRTDRFLNEDACSRPDYYRTRGGVLLEDDVKRALEECAKGTEFENTIEKVSGHRFPDIVAARFYGVEVKSTKDNHWTSTGSSILETTRMVDVERIFITFGKLGGNPIEFMSRPYEECLSGIAVTHMPRYLIDMRLDKGETIFDKIGIRYDELRSMDNPISPVSRYYRSKLKKGESLWWTGEGVDESVSATMRLWSNLSPEEKKYCISYGYANFPEIFGGDYGRYSLWLASQGIVNSNVRDSFSAGGQREVPTSDGDYKKMPAVFNRVSEYRDRIKQHIGDMTDETIKNNWKIDVEYISDRISLWCESASMVSNVDSTIALDVLKTIMKH